MSTFQSTLLRVVWRRRRSVCGTGGGACVESRGRNGRGLRAT